MSLLTPERHKRILDLLNEKQMVTVQELVETIGASESTVRRDLIFLENTGKLIRFHGGAELPRKTLDEPTLNEKAALNMESKKAIAKYAASLVQSGDCIFLDAGSTTSLILDYIETSITVVTNNLSIIDKSFEKGIKTYLIGGEIKARTQALIGPQALSDLKQYRFDHCFIGINGVHPAAGLTTPDPDEAAIKQQAIQLAKHVYVLADQSKFQRTSFAFVSSLSAAIIITNQPEDQEQLKSFQKETQIEVVTS